MRHGEHHVHKRKRIHEKHQEYPHPDPKVKLLDDIVWCVAVIMPLTTIPQIYKIWMYGSAAGVSLTTWVLYLVLAIPMLLYGIVHKEKQIMVMNALWIVVDAAVIAGTLLYG